jgi:hypothetical protein
VLKLPKYHFNAFRREKGQQVVAEYVVVDRSKLNEANYKYFPDISAQHFVPVSSEMLDSGILKDYVEVMRLYKTYVADPVVFDLCRQIEQRIVEILEFRFWFWGKDKWVISEQPLPLKNDEKEDLV